MTHALGSRAVPTFEQVSHVPLVHSHEVVESHLDENGHMNVRHYFEGAVNAIHATTAGRAGIDGEYVATREMGTFSAEHRIVYLSELRLGDRLSTRVQLLDRSAKALHALAYVVNDSGLKVSATFEALIVHVSTATRRPHDFPADIASRLDELIHEHRQSWAPPTGGTIRIRSSQVGGVTSARGV